MRERERQSTCERVLWEFNYKYLYYQVLTPGLVMVLNRCDEWRVKNSVLLFKTHKYTILVRSVGSAAFRYPHCQKYGLRNSPDSEEVVRTVSHSHT